MALGYTSTPEERIKAFPSNRHLVDTRNGIQIWEGKCEGCGKLTRLVWNGKKYLCINCLARTD